MTQTLTYNPHYYAESERIASKIGGGKLYDLHSIVHDEQVAKKISYNAKLLYHVMECTGSKAKIEDLNLLKILTHLHDSLAPEKHLFWYHPDHLGSSSWITYTDGKSVQHLHYLPFGESFVDQRISSFASRYTFSAKEKDTETGYGYFGARYYSSDLSIWISVDPMADKYPSMSPYVYCANNPIKLVDPNGEDYETVVDETNKTITIKATYYTANENKERLQKGLDEWNQQSGKYKIKTQNGESTEEYTINFDLAIAEGNFETDQDAQAATPSSRKDFNLFSITDDMKEDTRGQSDGIFINCRSKALKRTDVHEIGHTLGIGDCGRGVMLSGGNSISIKKEHIKEILNNANAIIVGDFWSSSKSNSKAITNSINLIGIIKKKR